MLSIQPEPEAVRLLQDDCGLRTEGGEPPYVGRLEGPPAHETDRNGRPAHGARGHAPAAVGDAVRRATPGVRSGGVDSGGGGAGDVAEIAWIQRWTLIERRWWLCATRVTCQIWVARDLGLLTLRTVILRIMARLHYVETAVLSRAT